MPHNAGIPRIISTDGRNMPAPCWCAHACFEHYRDVEPRFTHASLVHLSPQAFLGALLDHYLYSVLHELIYVSLMAEKLKRVRHLEGAVRHLDEKSSALLRKSNALRQEEIIEEIEAILLSTASQGNQPW
jgi:F-type H+-transporting ATPase subunit gamma